MLHPTELCCTLSELQCTLRASMHPLSLAAPFWATLNPSELRWTLLSYTAPYSELRWTLIELCCNLKTIIPPPAIAALLFLPVKIFYRENPVEIPVLEKIRESSVQHIILLYVPQPLPHPSQLRWSFRQMINRKTPRNIPVWQKIRQSIPQLI